MLEHGLTRREHGLDRKQSTLQPNPDQSNYLGLSEVCWCLGAAHSPRKVYSSIGLETHQNQSTEQPNYLVKNAEMQHFSICHRLRRQRPRRRPRVRSGLLPRVSCCGILPTSAASRHGRRLEVQLCSATPGRVLLDAPRNQAVHLPSPQQWPSTGSFLLCRRLVGSRRHPPPPAEPESEPEHRLWLRTCACY
jgi:hypothetical protein